MHVFSELMVPLARAFIFMAPRARCSTLSRGIHWSDKIDGGDAQDDKRYLYKVIRVGDERKRNTMHERTYTSVQILPEMQEGKSKLAGESPWDVQDVIRDRDNVILANDRSLIVAFVAQELGVPREAVIANLKNLISVLPSLGKPGRLKALGAPSVANMCRDVNAVLERLVILKELFVNCDVDDMVVASPHLLSIEYAELLSALDELSTQIFPMAGKDGTPGVDRMVQACPQLLDPSFARAAVLELDRLYGMGEGALMIHRAPRRALEVESASIRSKYSVSFDQTHVKGNRVIANPESEKYYQP